jgi:hypothetical protein
MSAGVKGGKAQNEQMFSALPPIATYFRRSNSSFLLQNCSSMEHAGYFMMHLLVHDVEAWWKHVQSQGVVAKYGVWTTADLASGIL